MKKIALAVAAAILGMSMMGMASNYPESADFIYTGTNDREAARLLMKSMQALNRDWEVEWYSEKNGVLIVSRELDDDESTLKPVLIVGVTTLSKGLDRVSMTALDKPYTIYVGVAGYKGVDAAAFPARGGPADPGGALVCHNPPWRAPLVGRRGHLHHPLLRAARRRA